MATRQSKEGGKSPSRQTGQLRRYQEFGHKVSYRHTLLRKPKMFFVLIPVTVILTSIALMAPIVVEKNTPPKIPSWQTDLNACLDFCQAGNLTFCSQFCSPANMTERLDAFYGDWHPTGNTLLPLLALPIGMVVLLLLSSHPHKQSNPPKCTVSESHKAGTRARTQRRCCQRPC
jgi:hypothetical protein